MSSYPDETDPSVTLADLNRAVGDWSAKAKSWRSAFAAAGASDATANIDASIASFEAARASLPPSSDTPTDDQQAIYAAEFGEYTALVNYLRVIDLTQSIRATDASAKAELDVVQAQLANATQPSSSFSLPSLDSIVTGVKNAFGTFGAVGSVVAVLLALYFGAQIVKGVRA